jgi:two-component system, OmpR family, sensor kinase
MQWHRSLYWRIAIGFVLFLAAMLVVQAVLFTWVVSRSGETIPGQSTIGFAQTVALDVGAALERDAQLDLDKYVGEQFASVAHPFFIMLASGRIVDHGASPIPEPLLRAARTRLRRGLPDPERPEREGGAPRRPIPILVNGELAGVVVVPARAPFGFLLRRFAPTLTIVASAVLIVGTVLASVLVFGPARRRLKAVEAAARRLGAGDLAARAPARGGDEVAAVASAFNAMADDLAARADALALSDRMRRQLLADVSHELTTPVTAMRGYLETLAMPDLELDEARKARYLGILSDETARLERIIGDLLDLARLEGGGGALSVADVPVSELFDRVAARHEGAAAGIGWSRRCRIWRRTPCAMRRRDRRSRCRRRARARAWRCRSPTRDPVSPPSTCRTSSIVSTRRRRPARSSRAPRTAAGSASRS